MADDRLRQEYMTAVLQHQQNVNQLAVLQLRAYRRRRREQRRRIWTRQWIARRPQFGMFDQLLVELRKEDQASFINFMRMPPEMFDELVARVGPRIQKGGWGVRTFRRGGGGSYRNFRSRSKLLQGPGQINKQKKIADSRRRGGGVRTPKKKTCIRACFMIRIINFQTCYLILLFGKI